MKNLQSEEISEAFALTGTSPFDAVTTDTARSITRTIDSTSSARTLGRYAGEMLQGIGWVLAALYFVGAAGLGAIILFHTFVQ